jgi:transcriptional regulator with XRE-family HTH domain
MFRPIPVLLQQVRSTLVLSQNGLAAAVGVSRRTGQRWSQGRGPGAYDLRAIARLVFPADASLAAELAEATGTTLVALGLLPPPAPAAAPPAPAVPDRVIDAVVCAAAEALQVMPQAARPAVLAAFVCARELGLSVADVERVLVGRARKPG